MIKTVWLTVVACALTFAATPTTSTATPKKKTAKRTVRSTAAPKTAAKSKTAVARSRSSKSTKTRRVARSYQQAPTAERYREIQRALVSKGYLQGEPTGQWGPDSVDALKRFQANQNLTADGKISSLSLIALGLGPKRLTAQSSPQAPATPATPVNPPK